MVGGNTVVMDNAPYHSRRLEVIPTSISQKKHIKWLMDKSITNKDCMLRFKLLELVADISLYTKNLLLAKWLPHTMLLF